MRLLQHKGASAHGWGARWSHTPRLCILEVGRAHAKPGSHSLTSTKVVSSCWTMCLWAISASGSTADARKGTPVRGRWPWPCTHTSTSLHCPLQMGCREHCSQSRGRMHVSPSHYHPSSLGVAGFRCHSGLKPGLDSAPPKHGGPKAGKGWLPRRKAHQCYPKVSIKPQIIATSDIPETLSLSLWCGIWLYQALNWKGTLPGAETWASQSTLQVWELRAFLFGHLMPSVLGPPVAFYHGLNNHSSLRGLTTDTRLSGHRYSRQLICPVMKIWAAVNPQAAWVDHWGWRGYS